MATLRIFISSPSDVSAERERAERVVQQLLLDAENVEHEREQFDRLKQFWQRWFRTEQGHFIAACHTFETTDGFETEVDPHLRQWLLRRQTLHGRDEAETELQMAQRNPDAAQTRAPGNPMLTQQPHLPGEMLAALRPAASPPTPPKPE